MPLPDSVSALVSAGGRRMLAIRLARRSLVSLAVGAVLAAALLGIARRWVIGWAEPVALAVVAFGVVATAVVTLARPPRRPEVALELDRSLGGMDRVSTALELSARDRLEEAERRQVAAAGAWAERRSVRELGAVWPGSPLPHMAALGVAAALVLSLVPAPTDAALAAQREERRLVADEADRLEGVAEGLSEEVADELAEVVRDLRGSPSVEEAVRRLGEARQELAASLDPADLARRTALAGLERRLEQRPLGSGTGAVDQLRELADEVEQADAATLTAAAEELEARASDFAGVDEALARALTEAAEALRRTSTDPSSAEASREALERLARAVEEASAAAEQGRSRSQAVAELRESQRRLTGQQGQGPGQGPGQGSGQGSGQGPGQGPGQGSGQGSGQGPGGGGGGSGAGGSSGSGSTPGGSGSGSVPPGGGDDDPSAPPARGRVFDPVESGFGDEVRVRIDGSDPGEVEGTTEGTGVENLPLTPYSDRYSEYRATALEALERLAVPPAMSDLVREYFTRLEP